MKQKNQVLFVIFCFLFVTKFFKFGPITNFEGYNYLLDYTMLGCFLFVISKFQPSKNNLDSVSKSIYRILVMFAFSFIWPTLFWGQPILKTLRGMQIILPLSMFFIFLYNKIKPIYILKGTIVLGVLYTVLLFIGLATFPNNIFGYSQYFEEMAEMNLEQRGIIRLNLPGSDFIVVLIFAVLTFFEKKKKWYLLLVPLFIVLLMRGTRTPLVVSAVICLGYYLLRMKRRWLAIIFLIVFYCGFNLGYDILLESNSDDILTKYVHYTDAQKQEQEEGETNIRILMIEHFFTEFNNNPLANWVGNGACCSGGGAYYKAILKSANNGWSYNDSLISNVFCFFGIIGLYLYLLLLWRVIKTRVCKEAKYAKLYVIYVFMIGVTNVQLLSIAPIIFAMNLYVVQQGTIGKLKWKDIL